MLKWEELKGWIGRRVEIPVHYDMWMRGARFGKVVARRRGRPGYSDYLLVRLDHSQVRRCLKVWRGDVDYMKELS